MNACEITAAVTAAANTIACRLNDEELALWSSVLVQLGDTLATIAAQRDLQPYQFSNKRRKSINFPLYDTVYPEHIGETK